MNMMDNVLIAMGVQCLVSKSLRVTARMHPVMMSSQSQSAQNYKVITQSSLFCTRIFTNDIRALSSRLSYDTVSWVFCFVRFTYSNKNNSILLYSKTKVGCKMSGQPTYPLVTVVV